MGTRELQTRQGASWHFAKFILVIYKVKDPGVFSEGPCSAMILEALPQDPVELEHTWLDVPRGLPGLPCQAQMHVQHHSKKEAIHGIF